MKKLIEKYIDVEIEKCPNPDINIIRVLFFKRVIASFSVIRDEWNTLSGLTSIFRIYKNLSDKN